MNYSYENIDLWDDATWADRDAVIRPVTNYLTKLLFETVKPKSKLGLYTGRTDGSFNTKTNAITFPDVVKEWEDLGMIYHQTGMGFVGWIALIPKEHTRNTPVLFTYHSADQKDPLWAMDTLTYYKDLGLKAVKERFAVIYFVQDGPFGTGIFSDIMMEVSALWQLDLNPFYLDVSALDIDISEIPGADAEKIGKVSDFNGVKALDIVDKWQPHIAHQYIVGNLNKRNPEFDFERLKHSPLGKAMADGMTLEYKYESIKDAGLIAELAAKGLKLDIAEMSGERYVVAALSETAGLPLLICMKEVRPSNEFQCLTALQFYSNQLDIAAAGDCGILFFAMESPDDNELLCDILDKVIPQYGFDRKRVYITGQSHNGYLALEFARRHTDRIAAIATLNDRHGIAAPEYTVDSVPVTDEMVDSFSKWDLPLINFSGEIENVFTHNERGSKGYLNNMDSFHRRLKAFRCPDKTDAEIDAVWDSSDKCIRKNGMPADRTQIVYTMGFEAYISDLQNVDGNWHLRFVTLENLPHMISPQMAELSWSFLRRFAREEDGSITELG